MASSNHLVVPEQLLVFVKTKMDILGSTMITDCAVMSLRKIALLYPEITSH